MDNLLHGFLADTWWYGLTGRLPDREFQQLAHLRKSQGFTAIQLVFGIPPEIPPEDPNAFSPSGPAWTYSGAFNPAYIQHGRERIQTLNQLGFRVIVYGAWGNQIGWLGISRMMDWWSEVIQATSDLAVIYCLAGESSLQPGVEDELLFKKYPSALPGAPALPLQRSIIDRLKRPFDRSAPRIHSRRRAWSIVLESISRQTGKPILVHPIPDESGFEAVENPGLLAANTFQSGHHPSYRSRLLELPLRHLALNDPKERGCINLEPWYEGILDHFGSADQLYAYWVSMLAGAVSYCYGAHGIWNVGDGNFLNHWGRQTFQQALALDTPRLLGLSHQVFLQHSGIQHEIIPELNNGQLVSLTRKSTMGTMTYLPDVSKAEDIPSGKVWLPLEGSFTNHLPASGQAVILF